ncbi:MAG: Hsp20 family protein [Alphaproteobacteria bacterium]
MPTALSLTPLWRTTVGFDRFNDLFQSLVEGGEQAGGYPPYNIVKTGEDHYKIAMAVAGFTERDLNITVHRDRVTVTGGLEAKEEAEQADYLYRGIATRSFERTFRLADYMKVTGAELRDGMLWIDLTREVPEEQKPRSVTINKAGSAKELNAKTADKAA